jgi:pteridine reductase
MPSGVALVTGSGKRRVGAAVAVALAKRGYDVAVHYRTSESEARATVEELQSYGVSAEAFRADLGNEAEVAAMIDAAFARFGRIDVLVNAAAVWQRKELEAVTAADVRANFEANLLGTFLCCQRIGLLMVAQETGGLIVTVGDWAVERPYAGYAAYFPSKAAIPGLTRTFAVELGTRNPRVRVNCVLPGPVMLPPDLPQEERDEAIAATLVKREGRPENVAAAVLSFLDNDFVTGVCLPVDGGRTIYAGGN